MSSDQSKPKFKQRYLIAGGLIAASSLVFFSPISAKATQISVSSISSLFGAAGVDVAPYMEYLTAAEDFYKAISTKNLSKVLSGIEVASGELGIPIPEEVQKAIDVASSVKEGQSAFGVGGSAALNQVLQGQIDASSTSTIAESTLSSEGQSDIVATKKSTAEAAASSLQSAQKASSSNVSQDILRDIANQMSNSVAIEKANYDTNVNSQVASAATSQAIGNISQTLAEDNWGKKVERQAGQVGIGDSTALFAALASPN